MGEDDPLQVQQCWSLKLGLPPGPLAHNEAAQQGSS